VVCPFNKRNALSLVVRRFTLETYWGVAGMRKWPHSLSLKHHAKARGMPAFAHAAEPRISRPTLSKRACEGSALYRVYACMSRCAMPFARVRAAQR
jgi:hypothetical protein